MTTTAMLYWASTVIVAGMMVFSAYMYFTKAGIKQAFQHLGYPDYFRPQLALAKLAGVVLLFLPFALAREWAYAGFTFTFVAAFVAHSMSKHPVKVRIMPLVFMVLLAVSYFSWHALEG